MVKKLLYLPVMFLIVCILSSSVIAVSIGVSPGRLTFRNVLKSGYAEREITVTTDSSNEMIAHFEKDGDIKDWIYFEPYDQYFSLSVLNPYKVKVVIEPPDDAKNGSYHATIRFVTDRFGQITGTAGGVVKAAVQIDVYTDITGEEIFKCRAGGFNIKDSEIGFPIDFSATVINDGNVRIKPKITIDIWDQFQQNLVLSRSFSDVEVLPTVQKIIAKQISSANIPIGQYWASISVGECEGSELLTFSIVEKGGIVDKGDLVEISNKPWAYVGETVQINVLFRNSGIRTETASFKGTIKLNDKILQVIQSEEIDVLSGDATTFSSYFTPEKPGRYVISGRVTYNKKITYEKGSVLNVNPVPQEPGKSGALQLFIYVLIIITILYLIRLILKEKRKRN
jgi:hypothetical protein